ncbi:Thrombospondin type-1 domain-containing protein 4 [Oryzias melastigma]|uniref:Thrombospondin type-1 domain-containing protein 4 n=1 Tax=Oryzias melastigma TaxID=30732 RepID=A0A834FGV5_ORYME|nr:Thrombospondin type-1 domain-containing protein 4 [Oryzias melastigma]
MAALWEQLCSLQRGSTGTLLRLLYLLLPLPGALLWNIKSSSYPLQQGFEVVRGNFSHSFLHVGYNKITEIPAGACNISIQETRKSRNYLALQTRSGISIINGNWVIDRPGTYSALGTQMIYKRPNEIRSRSGESIAAPGPLTDDLHLYLIYQQPGPSVHYEYSVPIIIHSSPEPDTPDERPPGNNLFPDDGEAQSDGDEGVHTEDVTNSITIKEKPHSKKDSFDTSINFVPQSTYIWTKTGHSECSSTCGTGTRVVFWECVDSDSQMTVPADFCDLSNEPTNQEDCSESPCPPYWDIGEWSECSRKCGPGSQLRQVICLPGDPSSCQQDRDCCRRGAGECSVPCGVGQRSREVVCVGNHGLVDEEHECNMSLKPDFLQNCDMGVCAKSWFTSLWSQRCSAECGRGNKTRSVVCLIDRGTDLPLDGCEGDRPPDVTSCDAGPCQNQLEWYTGPWSQVTLMVTLKVEQNSSASLLSMCGVSVLQNVEMAHRPAVRFASSPTTLNRRLWIRIRCSSLSKPITSQPCRLKPCGVRWYVTAWSTCSRSCKQRLPDPLCSDQFHNCVLVVQARLCVYPYYRRVCCSSCSRTQRTYPMSMQRSRIHR